MVKIDIRSRTPIYEQIIESIREMVVKGVLRPSDKLPSVREMAKEMTLNPNTVQKAYQELERQGLICTVRGRGTFICEDIKPKDQEEKINELLAEMKKLLVAAIYLGLKKEEVIVEIEKLYEEIRAVREAKDDKR
ncbi:GntR family transcriptional regulator [Acetoanaerobium pronyense]|uniref:GntR family transcriptional regulator n=1 Tax=Acetoanaerobium pronyense TaxID=1482736 RepID=A0ABS4KEQ7_9FIRM|nr:GntR family transcriptional regulator [Acetoanaerobium pronyense]MBP2026242.1 GntR family transcriptional regulator [Acetoanaerobium pronyense]